MQSTWKKWSLQFKAVLAAVVLGLVLSAQWLRPVEPDNVQGQAPRSAETYVIRTARNLANVGSVATVVQRLQEARVDDVWVQFKQDETDEFRGGEVFYPSKIAPVAAGFDDDRLGKLVQNLVDQGIRVSAWIPCFNDTAAWEAHPDWRAWIVGGDGRPYEHDNWLCPRSEEAVEYQSRIVAEVADRYPQISAIYTDFIRYDSDLSCVCNRCLNALAEEVSGGEQALTFADVVNAAKERGPMWNDWIDLRAQAICGAVDSMRNAIERVRPDLWFGACVLPFSAMDYSFNTQSGQDYYEMARVGLDELMVMGYWDDWHKSPEWLRTSLVSAQEHVKGECVLSCLIDGDMSARRTWLTFDAIRDTPVKHLGYFNYWEWKPSDFNRIAMARQGAMSGKPPRPEFTAVVIRIDTEPDYQRRYDTVTPDMIHRFVDLFDRLQVKATFVTCGKLAELQPDAVRHAEQRGHEIACHAYDHEQLDELTPEEERVAINQGLDALKNLGLKVTGFGAPRNSITDNGRDLLIERGLKYDGSDAYDPMTSFIDVGFSMHSGGDGREIIVLPFIMPNDWDALHIAKATPAEMGAMWEARLERVIEMGEPVFVLDVHQWLSSKPDNLRELEEFIEFAQSRPDVRIMLLRDAAEHARDYLAFVDRAASQAVPEPKNGELTP